MSDLFGNPVRAEPEPVPDDFRMTPAIRRVMQKAVKHGFVRRASGFSEIKAKCAGSGFDVDLSDYVDRCIVRGWLTVSEAFNTYPVTAAGRKALANDKRNVAEWRAGAKDRRNRRARERRAADRLRLAA